MNLWLIFLTGLTTGGLSCLAVQGGLLASVITNQKDAERGEAAAKTFDYLDWVPVTLFLAAKLVSHLMLGFLLGWLGSKLQISLGIRLVFQAAAAFFMFATAMNLLEVHPIFRHVVIQPPAFLRRYLKKTAHGSAFLTPAILGFLTIFIPCGVTQSMEVLAMTSGSGLLGAALLGTFVLGTSPLFGVLGVATARLGEQSKMHVQKMVAAILIVLALISINGVLVVMNSPVTFATLTQPIVYFFSDERFDTSSMRLQTVPTTNGVQQVLIQATNNGYVPNYFRVKSGMPVNLTVQTKDTYTCASYFRLKAFGVKLQLGPNDSQSVAFTPTAPGKYQFSCSMGMYTGTIEVL